MNCMKCGREIPQDRVFCDHCMADMEKYPVRPDVVVKLPPRNSSAATKKAAFHRKPPLPDKEQIRILRQRVRRLAVLLGISLILLALLGGYTVNLLLKDRGPLPGQNYSTVTTKPASED